jgi:ABC-type Zn uptake system ZnuABC Zn-binding protein ZnuA
MRILSRFKFAILALTLTTASFQATGAEPLLVCVSTPDIESLAREIGGDQVRITSFSSGPEDPHEIELRPSFVKALNDADLYIQVGLGIENAWLKNLLTAVKTDSVKPGGAANLNLGSGVTPLEGEQGQVVPGSYHEDGNPHYLLDPIEGYKAARAIARKLGELRPKQKEKFDARLETFREKLATALLGKECAEDDPVEVAEEFAEAAAEGRLDALLKKHDIGGWLKRSQRFRGTPIVGDHDLWPYFARRYGLEILGYLEPSPGVPPTTRHLRKMIGEMKERKVKVILTAPYFDPKPAHLVNRNTGATIVPTVHQTGGRPGTEAYLDMLKHNFNAVFSALEKSR